MVPKTRSPILPLDELDRTGVATVPGFLNRRELARASSALEKIFPSGKAYHQNPDAYPELRESPFSGVRELPFGAKVLNHLPFHPGLLEIAESVLRTTDLRLAKTELWAKYAGAAEYAQDFHRDYGNHSLVVPRADRRYHELCCFLYLRDVGEDDGPLELLPRDETDHISLGSRYLAPHPPGRILRMTGEAGTLILFSYDIFHRASELAGNGARFVFTVDYRAADAAWVGKHNWASRGTIAEMSELITALGPRERTLLDFPAPGHPYWNAQTIEDVQKRYPGMNTKPYRQNVSG